MKQASTSIVELNSVVTMVSLLLLDAVACQQPREMKNRCIEYEFAECNGIGADAHDCVRISAKSATANRIHAEHACSTFPHMQQAVCAPHAKNQASRTQIHKTQWH